MAWTAKKKAIAFTATLLLVSVVLVGSAAATTNSALRPFLRGEEFATERSLTRGNHVALALRIAQEESGELKPVEGATVVVSRLDAGVADPQVVATKTSGPRGGVVFELRPGPYQILVESDAGQATHGVRLQRSVLLGLTFDAEGQPHWQPIEHRELERRGERANLLVRVGQAQEGARPTPVANATVEVHRIERDNSTVLVATLKTGPRGFASFSLAKGPYLVKVTTENATGQQPLRVQGDVVVGAVEDDGSIQWRVQRTDAHQFQSPSPARRPR